MKITIENTDMIVSLNGVPARIWEGKTESGIRVHCFITRIAIDADEPRANEFEDELLQQRPPTAEVNEYSPRLIL